MATLNAVTGQPAGGTPGTPVYVVAGVVEVEEPLDVNLRDLRPDDPIEPNAPGLAARLVPSGLFFEKLVAVGDDVKTLARTVGPNNSADSQSVVFALDMLLTEPAPTDAPGVAVRLASPTASSDPGTSSQGVTSRLVPDGLFYNKLAALASTIGPNVKANAQTVRFPTDSFPTRVPATGAASPAQRIDLLEGPGFLFFLHARFAGSGAGFWLQVHDAAAATALSDSTMTRITYPLDQLNKGLDKSFATFAPCPFANGIAVAMSSTEDTYTAASTANVVAFVRGP